MNWDMEQIIFLLNQLFIQECTNMHIIAYGWLQFFANVHPLAHCANDGIINSAMEVANSL